MPSKSRRNVPKKQQVDSMWRSVFKWFSFSLAGAIFIIAGVAFYVYFSLLDTSRFMNIVGPLIEKPAVQTAIATEMTDALFKSVDVEKVIADSLPEKASFLAPSIYGQVKTYTQNSIDNVLKNEKFQVVWQDTLRTVHSTLVSSIKEAKGDGTININDVYLKLNQKIDSPNLQFLQNVELPSSLGSIRIMQASWLPVAHHVVVNIYIYQALSVILLISLLIVFVWLSRNKRLAFIQIGLMFAILSLIMLLSLKVSEAIFLRSVDSSFVTASSDVWNAVFSPLISQLFVYSIVGATIAFAAWLGGDYKKAVALRKNISRLSSNGKK